ncbi:MAG: dTDP-4-dehydrorhamnose reductase [Erythrobacter sp.]|uniref:dTDP-4-dehydrorhamnose reductase n=1 Tax=Erythrobacter sp. HL-111 TaxID=1798193 RepID=UPI0006D9551D|nr:dTDP-4-dehydrorhamnose reductase [Erythrobacter sp. HL-111]KPP94407.1 MAG: dTDP-4-dehydrorhamnose reductase RmlD [Erythrobacteraceae bacterium HL-111]SDS55108.1 dTDP-4-dehydrorhamnose reductase [Erythrobacter sp. HL-111]
MKVLVTGAGGQLGGALQRCAPDFADLNAIDVDDVDLTDAAMLRARLAVEAPDLILNAAAYTAVDRAEEEEDVARAINSDAVGIMAEAMEETGGKLVHVSTDFVFDGAGARAYRPGDEPAPLSAYGRTKAEGEAHCRASDLLVRTAWVYEAGGANFVRTMLRLMKERGEVAVVADQIGSPTWATGLARTIWALVEREANGIFHHSDAGVASWYDFAVAIAEEGLALGLLDRLPTIRPITTADYPTPARRPAFSLLDCRATREAIGDAPVHWRENLRHMLREETRLG